MSVVVWEASTGDDEFTKPAGNQVSTTAPEKNGDIEWYGKPSILHLRKERRIWNRKDVYRSRENRNEYCVEVRRIAEYFNVDPVLLSGWNGFNIYLLR